MYIEFDLCAAVLVLWAVHRCRGEKGGIYSESESTSIPSKVEAIRDQSRRGTSLIFDHIKRTNERYVGSPRFSSSAAFKDEPVSTSLPHPNTPAPALPQVHTVVCTHTSIHSTPSYPSPVPTLRYIYIYYNIPKLLPARTRISIQPEAPGCCSGTPTSTLIRHRLP